MRQGDYVSNGKISGVFKHAPEHGDNAAFVGKSLQVSIMGATPEETLEINNFKKIR
jgi:hypothetical protein